MVDAQRSRPILTRVISSCILDPAGTSMRPTHVSDCPLGYAKVYWRQIGFILSVDQSFGELPACILAPQGRSSLPGIVSISQNHRNNQSLYPHWQLHLRSAGELLLLHAPPQVGDGLREQAEPVQFRFAHSLRLLSVAPQRRYRYPTDLRYAGIEGLRNHQAVPHPACQLYEWAAPLVSAPSKPETQQYRELQAGSKAPEARLRSGLFASELSPRHDSRRSLSTLVCKCS